MNEKEFLQISNQFLHDWNDELEKHEDDLIDEVNLVDGVMRINVNDTNIFVINRQVPNRQIWYSSPVSGPQRFDYNNENQIWENTKKRELFDFLMEEIQQINKNKES